MERNPALRDAMRRHILTEELLQLPAQVSRLETDVTGLKEGQARLETDVGGPKHGDEIMARVEPFHRERYAPNENNVYHVCSECHIGAQVTMPIPGEGERRTLCEECERRIAKGCC